MHIVFIEYPNGLLNIAVYYKILESGQSLRFNLYLYPSNFFFFLKMKCSYWSMVKAIVMKEVILKNIPQSLLGSVLKIKEACHTWQL